MGCRVDRSTSRTDQPDSFTETSTLTVLATAQSPTATRMPTSTLSPTPSKTIFPQPEGCLKPPDDYTRLVVNWHTISVRTLAMLEQAYSLYGGPIDFRGPALTQGHYTEEEAASFGTHSGGGAVDISVVDKSVWRVMYEEIDAVIAALRAAGFAAWLRGYGELYPDSPIHVHAIAIGDAELSFAAQEQLVGDYGYFLGFNGLPQDGGEPLEDQHGGPIICAWMLESGYRDLRDE